MKRTILIHHHIFKNAGTSFNAALKQNFHNYFLEYDLPESKLVTQKTLDNFIINHPQALAISGHHICLPTPQSDSYQTISSILIRHPLSRIKSVYSFEKRQNAQTTGAIQAKKLNFQDYILWLLEYMPATICNYQTLYCSRTKNYSPKYLPTEDELLVASKNLANCLIVGTVERYADTLNLANTKLQFFFPHLNLEYKHINKASAYKITDSDSYLLNSLNQELGKPLVDKLIENNHLDIDLYQQANQMLDRRLQNI